MTYEEQVVYELTKQNNDHDKGDLESWHGQGTPEERV